MSVQAITWALQQDVAPTGAKFLLTVLANFDNPNGIWPTQELLADMTSQSVRTVRDHLARLEAAGLIRREASRDEHGWRSSDVFHLVGFNIEEWCRKKPKSPAMQPRTQPAESAGRAGEIQPADSAGREIPSTPRETAEKDEISNRQLSPTGNSLQPATFAAHIDEPKESFIKKKTNAKKERKPPDGIEPGEIEAFLAAMPRVDLPDDATREYIKARLAGSSAETLCGAARHYARAMVDREVKFIKDAAKWLAGGGHKVAAGNGGANGSAPRSIAAEGVPADLVNAWKQVRARMWSGNGADNYRSWIRPLVLTGTEDGFAVVEAPSQTAVDWVAAQYGRQLDAEWREAAGIGVRITGPTQAALTRTGT